MEPAKNIDPSPSNFYQPLTYSWKVRRRTMFTVLGFCMAVIAYILWKQIDTAVAQTMVTMSFSVIGAVLMSYVFAASYEDVKRGEL